MDFGGLGLKEFLLLYRPYLIWSLVSFVVGLIVYKHWDDIKLFWLNFKMDFPFFGKVKRLSKDYNTKIFGGERWFNSEVALCDDYYIFYRKFRPNVELYDNAKSYLQKVQELDRKPFPWYMWIIVFTLVLIEALGFAYVLAGYTLPGASEKLQQEGAFAIAILISIILVAFTHYTGHEIYKNKLIRKIRVWFLKSGDEQQKLEPDNRVTLEKNSLDDSAPNYSQLLNRLNTNAEVKPSWAITAVTAFLIITVAIGATYVRIQVLEQEKIEMTRGLGGEDLVAPLQNDSLPADLLQESQRAEEKAQSEEEMAYKKGGWATFAILAVVFVFIQLLGIIFGYRWGFAGKESKIAYNLIHRFPTRKEYEDYHKEKEGRIVKMADKRLQRLQALLRQVVNSVGTRKEEIRLCERSGERDFRRYVMIREREEQRYEQMSQQPAVQQQEEREPMQEEEGFSCSECGAKMQERFKFCPVCGAPQKSEPKPRFCANCGTEIAEGAKFCHNCGEEVAA